MGYLDYSGSYKWQEMCRLNIFSKRFRNFCNTKRIIKKKLKTIQLHFLTLKTSTHLTIYY